MGKYDVKPDFKTAKSYYDSLPEWARREVSTSTDRFAYIMGVLDSFKPVTMAEVGISAGTLSAALLLKSTQYAESPLLYGIDYSTHAYYDENIPIAKTVFELYPELAVHLDLHTEKTSLDADAIIKNKLDFIYIDANHSHPWASLDCANLLPHLKKGGIIGFHDTAILLSRANAGVFTFRSLELDSIEEVELDTHGSGFCFYDGEADNILSDLLRSFSLPWETSVEDATIELFIDNIGRNFGSDWRIKFADQLHYAAPFYKIYHETQKTLRKQFENSIHNSTSWKITAPLRWVKKILEG